MSIDKSLAEIDTGAEEMARDTIWRNYDEINAVALSIPEPHSHGVAERHEFSRYIEIDEYIIRVSRGGFGFGQRWEPSFRFASVNTDALSVSVRL